MHVSIKYCKYQSLISLHRATLDLIQYPYMTHNCVELVFLRLLIYRHLSPVSAVNLDIQGSTFLYKKDSVF